MAKVNPLLIIPTVDSTDQQWIFWHKSLKEFFNKKKANILLLMAWEKRNINGIISDGKANTVYLREYLEKQGMKIEKNSLSYVADFFDDTTDMISGFIGTARKSAMIVSLIIFGLIIYLLVSIIRKPENYASLIKTIATRGLVK